MCAVIGDDGVWCTDTFTPVRDTEGHQLSWSRTENWKMLLLDSAGNPVRDADGLTIRVDRLHDNRLEHADDTPVLGDDGKPLDLTKPVDLGRLKASSWASEDAIKKRINPDFKDTVLATDKNGRVLTEGALSRRVRVDGKPLFGTHGVPIIATSTRLFNGGDSVTYPDGRDVYLTDLDVEALLKSPQVIGTPSPEDSQPLAVIPLPTEPAATP